MRLLKMFGTNAKGDPRFIPQEGPISREKQKLYDQGYSIALLMRGAQEISSGFFAFSHMKKLYPHALSEWKYFLDGGRNGTGELYALVGLRSDGSVTAGALSGTFHNLRAALAKSVLSNDIPEKLGIDMLGVRRTQRGVVCELE